MYKTITVVGLREGIDKEKYFEYHTKVHSRDALKCSGGKMRKYVINRVNQVLGGESNNCFVIVEMWWDSKEDHDAYVERGRNYVTASGKNPSEDANSHGGMVQFKVFVDELEIPTK